MLATPTRRRRRPVVCGRRHCIDCKRWRHVIDYDVATWADLAKTRPKRFSSRCGACRREYERRQYRRRGHPCPAPLPTKTTAAPRTTAQVIADMPKVDRYLYEMEGILPLGDWSLADEDYDLTPVPTGCPSCYLYGGVECVVCPDPDVKKHRREARKQGLIQP